MPANWTSLQPSASCSPGSAPRFVGRAHRSTAERLAASGIEAELAARESVDGGPFDLEHGEYLEVLASVGLR